ncbi:MAG: hypothetical protein JWO10_1125 [Microbacteriaceae bacterium]|nr:hypothetical protein [Microbacteriaceae bacterium]
MTKTPYTIDVFDLMHRPGEMRDKAVDIVVPEGFGNAVIGVKAGSELRLDLRMESLHDGILVSVDVDGTASGECVRCLIDIEEPVQVEIQELFAYSHDEAFEYEVHEDTIDLEPVTRDAVVLSLPFQPVCQEDCTGLCPQCGVRLLDNPGHKHENAIDPRWAALGGLASLESLTTTDLDGSADIHGSADSAIADLDQADEEES